MLQCMARKCEISHTGWQIIDTASGAAIHLREKYASKTGIRVALINNIRSKDLEQVNRTALIHRRGRLMINNFNRGSLSEEMIDAILGDSFPASDPPPWTLGREDQPCSGCVDNSPIMPLKQLATDV